MGHVLTRRLTGDERGTSIVTALMITFIVFTLGVTWMGIASHQVESSAFERKREQALHAAEAGINLAVSRLAGDITYAGTTTATDLPGEEGEYEITVEPVDPTDPADLDRYIVAKGYAPSATSERRAVRQLEQQVTLVPTDGFNFALFASPGGIIGQNNMTVTGDSYSAADVTLANFAKVFGDVVSRGNVTTGGNNTIGGDVHALGNVTVDNSQTTVQENVYAGGNVTYTGIIGGGVQAGGTVTRGTTGSVAGDIDESSPPEEPAAYDQPTFTWDPANYSGPLTWSSASAFATHWGANRSAMSGAHRVGGGDSTGNTLTLDQRWTMTGDVTIVSDGPVTLSRDIVNGAGTDLDLVVVTTSTLDPAIRFSNNVTVPSSIHLVLFAPDGVADFSQLKDFHGIVYAHTIRLSQQFTLSYAEPDIAGFSWDASSATHFDVEVGTFREVPVDP